jgi:RNA polymerase sigma-70 factor, ECF subfamily
MTCQADRPDRGIHYRSLSNFYLTDPCRIASRERDLGLWWRVGLHGPTYRAAWVRETGELYAARLGMPKEQGEVYVLGKASDEELEEALAGWADICPQPDSMTWLRHRAASLAQPEAPRTISSEQRDLAVTGPRAQQTMATLIDRDRHATATRLDGAGVGHERAGNPRPTLVAAGVERELQAWVERLRGTGPERDRALVELHALLLRAARFEIGRRIGSGKLRGGDHDDLAQQSADDALVAILRKLEDFRGESRFTTWAYKFALYEAAAKVRKRSWQGREIPLSPEAWPLIADEHQRTAQQSVETADQLSALHEAIEQELSPHQREVLIALALNEVPIDVLAERLNTTRGALYKTLHDGRQKLRGTLTARGLGLNEHNKRENRESDDTGRRGRGVRTAVNVTLRGHEHNLSDGGTGCP